MKRIKKTFANNCNFFSFKSKKSAKKKKTHFTVFALLWQLIRKTRTIAAKLKQKKKKN